MVMGRRIVCMCGYVVQGDDEELWRNAEAHMGLLHAELAHRPQASWGFTKFAGKTSTPLGCPWRYAGESHFCSSI